MASLRDIAEMTGLSMSTVSRALNDDPRITEATRLRVREAAGKVEYHRNVQASVLAGRPARMIGFMASQLRFGYDAEIMRGVEDAAKAAGYRVLISLYYDDESRIESYRQLLDQPLFDAVIVGWSGWVWRKGSFGAKPVVYVDLWPDELDKGHVVTSDHCMSASLLVDLFTDRGLSRVVYHGYGSHNAVEVARVEALRGSCEAKGLGFRQVSPDSVGLVALSMSLTADDALVVEPGGDLGTDAARAAAGAARCYCGFFDDRPEELRALFPNAAVVVQDHVTMGRVAVGVLIDRIGGRTPPQFQFVPVTVRELSAGSTVSRG